MTHRSSASTGRGLLYGARSRWPASLQLEGSESIEHEDGALEWRRRRDGVLHRVAGPAVRHSDGAKEWWLEGDQLTERLWAERVGTVQPPEFARQRQHEFLKGAERRRCLRCSASPKDAVSGLGCALEPGMGAFGVGLPLNALEQDLGATIAAKIKFFGFTHARPDPGLYIKWIAELMRQAA